MVKEQQEAIQYHILLVDSLTKLGEGAVVGSESDERDGGRGLLDMCEYLAEDLKVLSQMPDLVDIDQKDTPIESDRLSELEKVRLTYPPFLKEARPYS